MSVGLGASDAAALDGEGRSRAGAKEEPGRMAAPRLGCRART